MRDISEMFAAAANKIAAKWFTGRGRRTQRTEMEEQRRERGQLWDSEWATCNNFWVRVAAQKCFGQYCQWSKREQATGRRGGGRECGGRLKGQPVFATAQFRLQQTLLLFLLLLLLLLLLLFFGALKRKISPSCNKNPRRLLPTLPASAACLRCLPPLLPPLQLLLLLFLLQPSPRLSGKLE